MSALDLELSNASLAMKIGFYKVKFLVNLETLHKLQSRLSQTVSSTAAFTANTAIILQKNEPS